MWQAAPPRCGVLRRSPSGASSEDNDVKALLLFGLLVVSAAVNLLLNVYVPNGLKLLLVPVFGLVLVIVLGRSFRRPG